jgi:hypothetical protein
LLFGTNPAINGDVFFHAVVPFKFWSGIIDPSRADRHSTRGLEDRVMASRKWLSPVFALAAMLWVGWLVGTQSASVGQQATPADDLFGSPDPPAADARPVQEGLFGSPDDPAKNPRIKTPGKTLVNDISGDAHAPATAGSNEASFTELAELRVRNKVLERELVEAEAARERAIVEAAQSRGQIQALEKVLSELVPPRPKATAISRSVWEYTSTEAYSDEKANELGKEGWELVGPYFGFGPIPGRPMARNIYKRPFDPNAPAERPLTEERPGDRNK